jgi:AbrB family looped-hinge helix DNA binding protein
MYDFILRSTAGNTMKAKVAERGQVTIPKALRKKLGLAPGTLLDFEADDGRLVAVKVQPRSPVDAVFGTLGRGRSTDDLVSELRDPA